MHPRSTPSLLRALAGHFIMGAGLGAFLALSVMAAAAPGISQMISNAASPGLTRMILVTVFALIFAVGATLTGWIFTAMERG
jgi:hypothetical protein